MLQDLKNYKLLLDAIKFSIYNNNVENRYKYFNVLEHVPKEEKYGNLTLVFMNILKNKEKENKKRL